MKTYLFAFILIWTTHLISAQSESDLIKNTLQNYIHGSSYNEIDQLKSAFETNATLYLTLRDGFKRITPEDYSKFFEGGVAGEFNGRHGKILALDIISDIATAKVEISFPERDMVYIDLFLLKKTDGDWKIISKTATRVDKNN